MSNRHAHTRHEEEAGRGQEERRNYASICFTVLEVVSSLRCFVVYLRAFRSPSLFSWPWVWINLMHDLIWKIEGEKTR